VPSQHAIVSDRYGNPCGQGNGVYFVEDCDVDTYGKRDLLESVSCDLFSVFIGLNHLYKGQLETPSNGFREDNMLTFSQVTTWHLHS